MAAWVLACANCKVEIQHHPIDDSSLLNYLQPIKPQRADERFEITCPSCGHQGNYGFRNLYYRG
jgi:hypothetical protein